MRVMIDGAVIDCTPLEFADLLRNLQNGGPERKAVDFPAAVREVIKPYVGRHEKEEKQ